MQIKICLIAPYPQVIHLTYFNLRIGYTLSLPRYFGYGRSLTFLTWTSNQYSQYGTLVTPPTHREVAYTLDKILDNDSEIDIQEHTTDTNGYTDLIFALFDQMILNQRKRTVV